MEYLCKWGVSIVFLKRGYGLVFLNFFFIILMPLWEISCDYCVTFQSDMLNNQYTYKKYITNNGNKSLIAKNISFTAYIL